MKKEKLSKPILKWVGGKSSHIPHIISQIKEIILDGNVSKYFEPFVGGGALFFYLASHFDDLEYFYISDVNHKLIGTYNTIKQEPDGVINELKEMENSYNDASPEERKKIYYEIRGKFNQGNNYFWDSVYFLFLNKTCFNGLYRVNKQNRFNVPHGKYKKIYFNENVIKNASNLLQRADIKLASYQECYHMLDNHSFIFFDPPYTPVSKTSSFTQYQVKTFGYEQRINLFDFINKIHYNKKAYFMLTNSFVEENSGLYRSAYKVRHIEAQRTISSNPNKRNKVSELIVTNF